MKFLHIPFSGGELPSALMAWRAWHRSTPLNAVYSGPTLGRVKEADTAAEQAGQQQSWGNMGYDNMQKARWMDAAGEGRSRKGIGLRIDSLVPSSISLQREQQACSDVSGPSLSPEQERQSLTAQWFHILGGDSICYAPETLQRSGIGIFFVILFEYIYKMRVNFLVLFCYISFPLFH